MLHVDQAFKIMAHGVTRRSRYDTILRTGQSGEQASVALKHWWVAHRTSIRCNHQVSFTLDAFTLLRYSHCGNVISELSESTVLHAEDPSSLPVVTSGHAVADQVSCRIVVLDGPCALRVLGSGAGQVFDGVGSLGNWRLELVSRGQVCFGNLARGWVSHVR